MQTPITRRHLLALATASAANNPLRAAAPPLLHLAHFTADVTVPLGHALMGGGIAPAKRITDPLFAHGLVFLSGSKPVVIVTVDWCEIRNDAFERWREALALAARTTPQRVFVSSIHQHDAPVVDLTAEKLLRDAGPGASICDPTFHEKAVRRVASALTRSLRDSRKITHVGTGEATVVGVASNRRFVTRDGHIDFSRTSATRDAFIRSRPEGPIDPTLKTLSFWDGDRPIAALSVYATHPMSVYGQGNVSADFVGLARKRQQARQPTVAVLYGNGAAGNVTAGKYNDGNPANRERLATSISTALATAWTNTRRRLISEIHFRSIPYQFEPRADKGFSTKELQTAVQHAQRPFGRCLAALGLSWRNRVESGKKLDLPVLDLGVAQLLLLPGESYVEFQLAAQKLRPDSFVVCLGYGECGTGYVPTAQAVREKDTNLHDWCWVASGADKILTAALRKGLLG